MNASAWRRTVNRFHYWKWVTFIRYATTYGKTYAPFFHLALGGSLLGMWAHKHSRDTSKRNVQYVERKANISYQAEQIELALAPETPVEISELENAVHRVRKGEFLPSLKTFYGMYNDVFSGAGYKVLPPAPFASEKNVDSNGFSAWLKAKGEGLPAEQREEMQKALNAFYRKFAAAQDTLLNSKKTEADVKNYHRALDEGVRDLNRTANQIRGLPATPKRTRPEFGPVLTDADVKAFTDLELARVISNRHE